MNELQEIEPIRSLKEVGGFSKEEKLVYIAGPVSGRNPYDTAILFAEAGLELANDGFTIFDPLAHVHPQCSWEEAMRIAIHMMMICDYIYLLPGWQESKGASWEREIALKVGIQILTDEIRDQVRKEFKETIERDEKRDAR
ncbi:DUF4406 domain-containing protein [Cecembia rubra]|uniref:Uncharacterized protein DUF4406 n=1 Tax=Cecembia rubra TaxID=1485585 RepID=A0A2P8EAT0_9BACT|nr:DUF4406 domain-containing protein [Cecembia rubra]PSL06560.1 uncharacterized protein DUF4406 [Cecembia rubra]